MMKLIYFKQSGKYYTEVDWETSVSSADGGPALYWDVISKLKDLISPSDLPGLGRGVRDRHVLVEFIDGPPALIDCDSHFN